MTPVYNLGVVVSAGCVIDVVDVNQPSCRSEFALCVFASRGKNAGLVVVADVVDRDVAHSVVALHRHKKITHIHQTPLPFGRICFVMLVMRKGGESN